MCKLSPEGRDDECDLRNYPCSMEYNELLLYIILKLVSNDIFSVPFGVGKYWCRCNTKFAWNSRNYYLVSLLPSIPRCHLDVSFCSCYNDWDSEEHLCISYAIVRGRIGYWIIQCRHRKKSLRQTWIQSEGHFSGCAKTKTRLEMWFGNEYQLQMWWGSGTSYYGM